MCGECARAGCLQASAGAQTLHTFEAAGAARCHIDAFQAYQRVPRPMPRALRLHDATGLTLASFDRTAMHSKAMPSLVYFQMHGGRYGCALVEAAGFVLDNGLRCERLLAL